MTTLSLSILIVSFNTRDLLMQCLESIRRHPPPVPFEIITVDNGSRDGSQEMVAGQFPEVQLIQNTENLGFAAANNQSLQVAKGEIVLFLNSDTELLPGSLDPLLRYLASHPKVGIVGPTEQSENGHPYPTICPFPDLWFLFLTHTGLRGRFNTNEWINPYRGIWEHARRTGKPVAVDWLSGASLMVRRQVFDEIGPFDEGYFFYMEEADLCQRAHRTGWDVVFIPEGRLVHHGGGSTGKVTKGLLTLSTALSALRYFQKHRSVAELVLLKCQFFVEYVLKSFTTKRDDPRQWAYREILRAVLWLRPAQVMRDDHSSPVTAESHR